MKYLGIDYGFGTNSIGIFDSSKKEFTLKKYYYCDKILAKIYYYKYNKEINKVRLFLVKHYTRHLLNKLLGHLKDGEIDHVTLSSYSGSDYYLANTSYLQKRFADKKILHSDHFWGHVNSAKFHKDFEYPALVIDCSDRHSVIAVIPDAQRIKLIANSHIDYNNDRVGIGKLLIQVWLDELQEEFSWPGQPVKGRKNLYELYDKRGKRGNSVLDMKRYIKKSKYPLCEDVFRDHFPNKMKRLKQAYSSIELYRDDWVATQQQVLREIITFLRQKLKKKYAIKTFFISGGISRNPAFKNVKDCLLVPNIVGGDDGAGCFMAFLGYCVNEQGLVINHDNWKDYRYI